MMKPAAPVTRTFTAPSGASWVDALSSGFPDAPLESDSARRQAPDVDNFFAVELEACVGGMGSAKDDHVGACDHLGQRQQVAILDIGIGAEDARAFEDRELLQLVAERRAGVVGIALEGHPQYPERAAGQGL